MSAIDVLKPYLLLACVAFTIGFVGYWALGRAKAPPVAHADADAGGGPPRRRPRWPTGTSPKRI